MGKTQNSSNSISVFMRKMAYSILDFFNKLINKIKPEEETTKSDGKEKKFVFKKPRVYKLRGYTTTSRVDKKVKAEANHRLIRNFLVAAVFVLIIAILLIIFNPLKDIQELFRLIGI